VRRALPHLAALLCGVAAALVVGCGDRSNLIPAGDAQSLKDDLAQAQQAISAGDCAAATAAVARARVDALKLPNDVDRRLRARINDGIAALRPAAARDCVAAQTQSTPTTTETTPTETTPTTTETTPTTTQTTPTETTPTETTTTPTTPPSTDTTPAPAATAPDTGGTSGDGQP
jgi:hypothetical protein